MLNRMTWIVMIIALSVGPLVTPAAARPVKNTITATLNGKPVKWKGHFVVTSFGGAGVIGTKRAGGIQRTLGVACAALLTGSTFPLTPDPAGCTANYTEMRFGRHSSARSWLAVNDVQVTYTSFDGTVVTGTFSATLAPVSGTTEPLTVQGQFRSKVSG